MQAPEPSPFTPTWLRLLARLERRGPGPAVLDPERIRRRAEAAVGRSDLGPGGDVALQVLERTCRDVRANGRLTPFGARALHRFLTMLFVQRLRLAGEMAAPVGADNGPMAPPVFVVGWYRSGTTYLHHLLARLPGLRALRYWELRNPLEAARGSARTARLRTRMMNGIHRVLSPGFDGVHPIRADGPEECMHLFDHSLITPTPTFLCEAHSFVVETTRQEVRTAYDFYRRQLVLLHRPDEDRRFVLKWPYHLFHLETLLEVFPGARVVWIHRDPLRCLPSVCSLTEVTRAPFCHSVDRPRLGAFWLDRYESTIGQALSVWSGLAPEQRLDLTLDDLADRPRECLSRVCDWLQLSPDAEDARRIEAYLSSRPPGKSRGHRYNPADYALRAAEIRRRFSVYTDALNVPVEPTGR